MNGIQNATQEILIDLNKLGGFIFVTKMLSVKSA